MSEVKHDHVGHGGHEHPGYGVFLVVWLGLLVLTSLTVTVAGMSLPGLAVAVALLVAAVKATLVLLYFMHLKYESLVFKVMFLVCIGAYAIFIGLTFVDVIFR